MANDYQKSQLEQQLDEARARRARATDTRIIPILDADVIRLEQALLRPPVASNAPIKPVSSASRMTIDPLRSEDGRRSIEDALRDFQRAGEIKSAYNNIRRMSGQKPLDDANLQAMFNRFFDIRQINSRRIAKVGLRRSSSFKYPVLAPGEHVTPELMSNLAANGMLITDPVDNVASRSLANSFESAYGLSATDLTNAWSIYQAKATQSGDLGAIPDYVGKTDDWAWDSKWIANRQRSLFEFRDRFGGTEAYMQLQKGEYLTPSQYLVKHRLSAWAQEAGEGGTIYDPEGRKMANLTKAQIAALRAEAEAFELVQDPFGREIYLKKGALEKKAVIGDLTRPLLSYGQAEEALIKDSSMILAPTGITQSRIAFIEAEIDAAKARRNLLKGQRKLLIDSKKDVGVARSVAQGLKDKGIQVPYYAQFDDAGNFSPENLYNWMGRRTFREERQRIADLYVAKRQLVGNGGLMQQSADAFEGIIKEANLESKPLSAKDREGRRIGDDNAARDSSRTSNQEIYNEEQWEKTARARRLNPMNEWQNRQRVRAAAERARTVAITDKDKKFTVIKDRIEAMSKEQREALEERLATGNYIYQEGEVVPMEVMGRRGEDVIVKPLTISPRDVDMRISMDVDNLRAALDVMQKQMDGPVEGYAPKLEPANPNILLEVYSEATEHKPSEALILIPVERNGIVGHYTRVMEQAGRSGKAMETAEEIARVHVPWIYNKNKKDVVFDVQSSFFEAIRTENRVRVRVSQLGDIKDPAYMQSLLEKGLHHATVMSILDQQFTGSENPVESLVRSMADELGVGGKAVSANDVQAYIKAASEGIEEIPYYRGALNLGQEKIAQIIAVRDQGMGIHLDDNYNGYLSEDRDPMNIGFAGDTDAVSITRSRKPPSYMSAEADWNRKINRLKMRTAVELGEEGAMKYFSAHPQELLKAKDEARAFRDKAFTIGKSNPLYLHRVFSRTSQRYGLSGISVLYSNLSDQERKIIFESPQTAELLQDIQINSTEDLRTFRDMARAHKGISMGGTINGRAFHFFQSKSGRDEMVVRYDDDTGLAYKVDDVAFPRLMSLNSIDANRAVKPRDTLNERIQGPRRIIRDLPFNIDDLRKLPDGGIAHNVVDSLVAMQDFKRGEAATFIDFEATSLPNAKVPAWAIAPTEVGIGRAIYNPDMPNGIEMQGEVRSIQIALDNHFKDTQTVRELFDMVGKTSGINDDPVWVLRNLARHDPKAKFDYADTALELPRAKAGFYKELKASAKRGIRALNARTDAMPIEDALQLVASEVRKSPIVAGHNFVNSDLLWYTKASQNVTQGGIREDLLDAMYSRKVMDTLVTTRAAYPDWEHHRVQDVVANLLPESEQAAYNDKSHTGAVDIRATILGTGETAKALNYNLTSLRPGDLVAKRTSTHDRTVARGVYEVQDINWDDREGFLRLKAFGSDEEVIIPSLNPSQAQKKFSDDFTFLANAEEAQQVSDDLLFDDTRRTIEKLNNYAYMADLRAQAELARNNVYNPLAQHAKFKARYQSVVQEIEAVQKTLSDANRKAGNNWDVSMDYARQWMTDQGKLSQEDQVTLQNAWMLQEDPIQPELSLRRRQQMKGALGDYLLDSEEGQIRFQFLQDMKDLADIGAIGRKDHDEMIAGFNTRLLKMGARPKRRLMGVMDAGFLERAYDDVSLEGVDTRFHINVGSFNEAVNSLQGVAGRVAKAAQGQRNILEDEAKKWAINSVIVPHMRDQGLINTFQAEKMVKSNGALYDIARILTADGKGKSASIEVDDPTKPLMGVTAGQIRQAANDTVDEVLARHTNNPHIAQMWEMVKQNRNALPDLARANYRPFATMDGREINFESENPELAEMTAEDLVKNVREFSADRAMYGEAQQFYSRRGFRKASARRQKISSALEEIKAKQQPYIDELRQRAHTDWNEAHWSTPLDEITDPLVRKAREALGWGGDAGDVVLTSGMYSGRRISEVPNFKHLEFMSKDTRFYGGLDGATRSALQTYTSEVTAGTRAMPVVNALVTQAIPDTSTVSEAGIVAHQVAKAADGGVMTAQAKELAAQTMARANAVDEDTIEQVLRKANYKPSSEIIGNIDGSVARQFLNSGFGKGAVMVGGALLAAGYLMSHFADDRPLVPEGRPTGAGQSPRSDGTYDQQPQDQPRTPKTARVEANGEGLNGANVRLRARDRQGLDSKQVADLASQAGGGNMNVRTQDDTSTLSVDWLKEQFKQLLTNGHVGG